MWAPFQNLLEPKRKAGGQGKATLARASRDEAEPREGWLLCRHCRTRIATQAAIFAMAASGPVQVFPNPLGQMQVIITLRSAQALLPVGAPTLEYTWFAGYRWQIVMCAACRSHLGWHYQAVQGGEPSGFYGLLQHALVED